RVLEHTHAFIITPMHSIEHQKSVVVPDTATIEIQKIHCTDHEIEIVLDGQRRVPLVQNQLTMHKSASPIHLARLESTPTTAFPHWTQLSPSGRFAYTLLRQRGALTQTELVDATGLSSRTLRRAIQELLDHQLLTKRPYSRDQRQDLYHPR
ncbi:MAG: MarR family transcriptional regulator, partial [Candidatus Diapherotrites archaeon]|nr:MarR family transcriptional regulator [Candidatus Diapherotrites archaeon]